MAPLGLEQLKCKSNLLRVQLQNQCHLVDYGFIESSLTHVGCIGVDATPSGLKAVDKGGRGDDENVHQMIINRPGRKTESREQGLLMENRLVFDLIWTKKKFPH